MPETNLSTSTRKRTVRSKGPGQPSRAANGRTDLLDLLDENPLKVGAATLVLGFVAGLALPLTRKENELMGETRERLLARAKEAGQEALNQGQRMVVQAVANVREGVQEAVASADQQASKRTSSSKGTAKRGKKAAR